MDISKLEEEKLMNVEEIMELEKSPFDKYHDN